MNTLTKAQKESFIKIIEDIIEQARALTAYMKTELSIDYQYSVNVITREALENFEDELEETTP